MEIEVKIPNYLQIKHYQSLDKVYSLDKNLQTLHTISAVLDVSVDEVKKLAIGDVAKLWNEIATLLEDASKPEFYPIIEFEGIQYGFTPMSKMSLAEYIDIDNLVKDKIANLPQLLAILYRPITKHKIKDMKFRFKSSVKLIFTKDKVEHLMDYYEVEEYDSKSRKERALAFESFPISVGLGALSFFLGVANLSLADSLTSTLPNSSPTKQKMTREMMKVSKLTMGGFTRYMSWEKLPSFKLGVRTTFSL